MSDDIKKALLGGRKVQQVNSADLNPPKAARPQRPGQPVEKRPGIAPPYPIVPPDKVNLYMSEGPRKAEEVFGNGQSGKFDAELNELALKELAEEQGMTVEEYMKRPSRKLEQKIEPAMEKPPAEQTVDLAAMQKLIEAQAAGSEQAPPHSEVDDELEALERKRAELTLKKQKLEDDRKRAASAQAAATKKMPRNPILEKMREKLSLDRMKPAEVELEGIKFEMLPPPSSLHPWVLGQLALAEQAGQDAMTFKLKMCTACASLVKVEGMPIAEVLGLVEPGSIKDPNFPPPDIRLLTAQTLLEMMEGAPSIDGVDLFRFVPDMAMKLYQAFTQRFRDLSIRSSLDQDLYVYLCPLEGCREEHQDLKQNMKIFCQAHGVPMALKGKKMEVMSIPLP